MKKTLKISDPPGKHDLFYFNYGFGTNPIAAATFFDKKRSGKNEHQDVQNEQKSDLKKQKSVFEYQKSVFEEQKSVFKEQKSDL